MEAGNSILKQESNSHQQGKNSNKQPAELLNHNKHKRFSHYSKFSPKKTENLLCFISKLKRGIYLIKMKKQRTWRFLITKLKKKCRNQYLNLTRRRKNSYFSVDQIKTPIIYTNI